MSVAVIHGNKSQGARRRALADFKTGRVMVLVATDIAARGLDIAQLPLVVNYDLPLVADDYIHRVGRTGRAGHAGRAVSLVTGADRALLADIQRRLPAPLEQVAVDGFATGGSPSSRAATPRPAWKRRAARRPSVLYREVDSAARAAHAASRARAKAAFVLGEATSACSSEPERVLTNTPSTT